MQTLLTLLLWALSIDLIIFPLIFQILMVLSVDPLMIISEFGDMHTHNTSSPWALSIDLVKFPSMLQILIV
jgi:hypothetical protein